MTVTNEERLASVEDQIAELTDASEKQQRIIRRLIDVICKLDLAERTTLVGSLDEVQ